MRDAINNTALIARLLTLADDELILGQRDAEWTGHAPILEEDIAFSNIAQDELGHALVWYTILHEQFDQPDPDRLAFWRSAPEFRNATLVELPRGDWAFTVVRQYLFDAYEQVRDAALAQCGYQPIVDAAHAIKREEVYHLMHSQGWVLRLGDATEESHRRMQAALDAAWPHALGLFERIELDQVWAAQMDEMQSGWQSAVVSVLAQASLVIPQDAQPIEGGRIGHHTPHLSDLLHEMQKVARLESPETVW
jgi:ring-1,2-phenylacetyl-CoA epoxidase subunit PaaC